MTAVIDAGTWRDQAKCRDHPQVDFFPGRHDGSASPIAICMRCPVVKECYLEAQRFPTQSIGVWGGTTARQRLKIRTGKVAAPTWVQ